MYKLSDLAAKYGVVWSFVLALTQAASLYGQTTALPDSPSSVTENTLVSTVQNPRTAERWDQLSLKDKPLNASAPLLGEEDVLPEFSRELIRVQWRTGDPIDLFVIRPTGVQKPSVILYLYGYPSDTDRFFNDIFCKTVTKNGFAAIGFVSALTGQRYHDRPVKEWFISDLQEAIGASVHDVQMILNYLSTRGDLDMGHVGMYGRDSGGTIAILSAVVDQRIKAVDVMDPWGDWPDWLAHSPVVPSREQADYLKPQFLAKVASLDPVQLLDQLKGRPFRLQENLYNPAVPDMVRKRIDSALPPGSALAQYHDSKEYAEEVSTNGRMLDWLHSALNSSPLQQPDSTQATHVIVRADQQK